MSRGEKEISTLGIHKKKHQWYKKQDSFSKKNFTSKAIPKGQPRCSFANIWDTKRPYLIWKASVGSQKLQEKVIMEKSKTKSCLMTSSITWKQRYIQTTYQTKFWVKMTLTIQLLLAKKVSVAINVNFDDMIIRSYVIKYS